MDDTFADHYSVGVYVRITDQQHFSSNLTYNYAEFGVQAIQRFVIDKVALSHDDGIVKVCEVTLLDDEEQFRSLKPSEKRDQAIKRVKESALQLLAMYGSLSRSQMESLRQLGKRIREAYEHGKYVDMLFLIAGHL